LIREYHKNAILIKIDGVYCYVEMVGGNPRWVETAMISRVSLWSTSTPPSSETDVMGDAVYGGRESLQNAG